MRSIIKKKKCLLFKHEKNNQTLFNDWPTYCHTGILLLIKAFEKDICIIEFSIPFFAIFCIIYAFYMATKSA
jgi:hypothetical protein